MSVKLWQLRDGRYHECRVCADDTAAEWLKRYQEDEPDGVFVLSNKRPPDAHAKKGASDSRRAATITKKYNASMTRVRRLLGHD